MRSMFRSFLISTLMLSACAAVGRPARIDRSPTSMGSFLATFPVALHPLQGDQLKETANEWFDRPSVNPCETCTLVSSKRVWGGHAMVLYDASADARILMLRKRGTEESAAMLLHLARLSLKKQGMTMPPLEQIRDERPTFFSYAGTRGGKAVVGAVIAVFPASHDPDRYLILHMEYPASSRSVMRRVFNRYAVTLDLAMADPS